MLKKLEELINGLKPGFFGEIQVGVQNGKPCSVRITETYRLDVDDSSRAIRGANNGRPRQ